MPNDYSDIINLPRPVSKHPKMPQNQRAKQFAPFAALGNIEDAPIKRQRISNYRRIILGKDS